MADLDYRLVLNGLADAVVAADAAGQITYVNGAAEQLLGWPAADLVGQPLTTIIPPRLHSAHLAGFERYLTTRTRRLIGRPARVPALRRDGAEVEIELTLAGFILGPDMLLFVASLRDLRDRVELERQLTVTRYLRAANAAAAKLALHPEIEPVVRAVVEMLAADLDAILARIWMYEAATNTLHLRASAGLSTATNTSSRARIDVDTYPYKVAEVARTRRLFVKNGLEGDAQFEQEWVRSERLAAVAVLPLLAGDQLLGVLVCFFRHVLPDEVIQALSTFASLAAASINDVQLLRLVKQERDSARQRAAELTRQNEEKDNFLAMLGHELRNPLAAVQGTLHVMERRLGGQAELDRLRARMQRQVRRMGRLIDDLQDVSRISRGILPLDMVICSLTELVHQTIEEQRGSLEEKGLSLAVELPVEPLRVRGDPARLTQMLEYLVNNAVKFTDAGGRITVALNHQANGAALTVRDTGIGIEPAMLTRIFDSFNQAGYSLERNRGGLGLGLTLVRGLVELHQGDVAAFSQGLGRGAEFTVRLPLAEGEAG